MKDSRALNPRVRRDWISRNLFCPHPKLTSKQIIALLLLGLPPPPTVRASVTAPGLRTAAAAIHPDSQGLSDRFRAEGNPQVIICICFLLRSLGLPRARVPVTELMFYLGVGGGLFGGAAGLLGHPCRWGSWNSNKLQWKKTW